MLDPVAVGALPSRLKFAQQLLEFKPTLIRGNASEIYALATGRASGSGTDSGIVGLSQQQWLALAQQLPTAEVIATDMHLSPETRDAAMAQGRGAYFEGGTPLMGRFPGLWLRPISRVRNAWHGAGCARNL